MSKQIKPIIKINEGIQTRSSKIINELKGKCNGSHVLCVNVAKKFNTNIEDPELTQEVFIAYLQYISSSSYNSCISNYNSQNSSVMSFILSSSAKFIFPTQYFGLLMNHVTDTNFLKILENQVEKNPNYIKLIIEQENIAGNYGNNYNLICSILNSSATKSQSIKYIFSKIDTNTFISIITKIRTSINLNNENYIADYIKTNTNWFLQNQDKSIYIINNLPYKTSIIKEIFKIVSSSSNSEVKIELLNKAINNLDKNVMLTIFESSKDIIPDEKMIDNLLTKVYVNHGFRGASNNNIIAEIIDILIMYGLQVTKNIIIKLLNKTCYINNIERFNIPIDEDILYVCSNFSYYPYKFNIKPPISILIKECSKHDNLETIKKLKEYGGEYNTQCLIEACRNVKNGKVIKYLINDCAVKSNDTCIKVFEDSYKTEALELIIKGYDPDKNNEVKKRNETIEIDSNSTIIIEPNNFKFNKNDKSIDFKLKNKIKKFFSYKKNSIKYIEIYEILLKYLIEKKLVIGNYFVLNNDLAMILKLDSCSIIHIDQIHNILTYFLEPTEPN
jgi:hypothetical protein